MSRADTPLSRHPFPRTLHALASAALCLTLVACGASPSSSSSPSFSSSTSTNQARPPAPASATSIAPRNDGPVAVEAWTYNNKPGKNIRTANYSIYTTEQSTRLLNRLPGFVEAALRHYTTSLGVLPDPPTALETFIMSNRGEWERLTKQLMGADADVYLRIPRGGYAANGRGVYYNIGPSETLAIAGHEGWHQYTQRTFKQPLPTWLEEGIATFMEGHRWDGTTPLFLAWANIERFDQLRGASAAGALIPLDQLIGTSPQELLNAAAPTASSPSDVISATPAPQHLASVHSSATDATETIEHAFNESAFLASTATATESGPTDRLLNYYAQLWALVHFLNEGEGGKYAPALRELLADAASGNLRRKLADTLGERGARNSMMMRRGPAAIIAYFNTDLDQFNAEYRAFIEKVVAVRARDKIVRGVSPL